MRRVTRNGVIAVAAASGAMAVTVPAYADSAAEGAAAGSPGLISGNTIQLPVHVPVNVCGNTVNVVGLLNPTVGNECANESGGGKRGGKPGGAGAESRGKDSPGVLSGNGVQLPVHLPVNVSGNTVSVVGAGNAATGNESVNTSGDRPDRSSTRPAPRPAAPDAPPKAVPPAPRAPVAALADTGSDGTLPAVAGSAALMLGGAVLYRRFRAKAAH
ncbi:chaplin [Streptomyces sp. DG2A-72]|uniref:chaplin n=1 Tax=Streptomyces sp. DG2A-72 TaxID=3051386 RepID=UPI00265C2018|nr:chaplin [Streptomyces sp. DG2A-72]MDO0930745.1 chaplin [Streptomyces sp. DG2A-72]